MSPPAIALSFAPRLPARRVSTVRFQRASRRVRTGARVAILDVVAAHPGISVTQLGRRLAMTRNGAMHHLLVLEHARHVTILREHDRYRVFLAGAAPRADAGFLARSDDTRAAIVGLLRGRPQGLSRRELRELLPDVPERTRNHNIGRLLRLGLVVEREGARLAVAEAGNLTVRAAA